MAFDKKKISLLLLLSVVLLFGCVTVDRFNSQINKSIPEKDLKSDVDYIERKLEKLEPDLYHYISRKELEYKFDSLKATLNTPMTSDEFYFRLSPVIASIKQGHTQTFPLTKRLKHAERKSANSNGLTPFAHYEYELFDNRLYIVKNNSNNPQIKAGTEIVSVNGVKPLEIIAKYRNTFTSDGYNTTFVDRKSGSAFARFFYYQYGLTDSVPVELNYKDTLKSIVIYRLDKTKKTVVVKKTKEEIKRNKKLQAEESRKRRLLGYDPLRRLYSKMLTFPVKDSSVAVMKISDFMRGNYKKFYKQSFLLLDSLHTKTLILDVRDNGGGHICEINKLYSYLADSSFHLVDKSEVTSRTSLWHIGYYHDQPLWVQFIQTALLPLVAGIDMYTFLKTEKGQDHKYYFSFRESKLTKPQQNRFNGKVYVLING